MSDGNGLYVHCSARLGALHMRVDARFQAPWTVVFGPSASGKSSLLRCICGLWRPHGNVVTLHDHNLAHLPPHRRGIAMVAQQPGLFPHLDVGQNVRIGCRNPRLAEDLIDRLHLRSLAKARPHYISGGERQRVALARALATEPRVLLLDEVFTGMQMHLRDELISDLRLRLSQSPPLQIISVTHDVAEAFTCADEVVRLENGEVGERGPADVVLHTDRERLLTQVSAQH